MDPVQRLPWEVALRIFEFSVFRGKDAEEVAADESQILSMSLVCRSWHQMIQEPQLWHRICLSPASTADSKLNLRPVFNSEHKLKLASVHDDFGKHLLQFCADPRQLYVELRQLSDWLRHHENQLEITRDPIEASSTDDPTQTIEETVHDAGLFWSSKGSASDAADEYLRYHLTDDGGVPCLVTRIEVTPCKPH